VDLQRDPARGGQQADLDLRAGPVLLAAARLADLVLHVRCEPQGVGSASGALPSLRLVGFRWPPAEPGVRLSTHRALHEDDAVQVAGSYGLGMRAPR
jgi:hypothetical protein